MVGAHLSTGRSLDMTRHIRDRHAPDIAKNIRDLLVKIGEVVLSAVLNVVSNILFSEDVVGMRVHGGQLFKDTMVAVLEDWTKPNVSDPFPFLAPVDLLGSPRRVLGCLTKLYDFFDDEFIERRLASGEIHNDHGNMLDLVLARRTKSELTRSKITKFFLDIFLATSSIRRITVEWAMALLLVHQDKMKKVQAELMANRGSKDFIKDYDLDKQLPYLNAVVKER
ncbi:hypothetical protein BAE44_0012002 [Dichanthelium oligosanthes]|uniref:Uncharacterized protein n=1 Tax=Dichanthelium oligosanthes TaxID=888268 RepID=A0A1E5VPB7_9POAL|nr:hypothetical protein BAE44_0012002 [Dichanthelium oligosanthes]